MATPFLGEIKIVSFNFPPKGWALCNGQTLAINQNAALFSLLGTTYGGNGTSTFQLPNLQGRVAVHMGNGFSLGGVGGEVDHQLLLDEMPAHTHSTQAADVPATTDSPVNAALAIPASSIGAIYGPAAAPTTMANDAIANAGDGQPHTNMQPYLVLNFCIALAGIFPSQN